jgi:hypothetical protein
MINFISKLATASFFRKDPPMVAGRPHDERRDDLERLLATGYGRFL